MARKEISDLQGVDIGLTEAQIRTVLNEYVAPVMREILLNHIASDIYGAYSPKEYAWIGGETYHRKGSLLSEMALYSEITGNTIFMTSDAEPENLWGGGLGGGHGAFLAVLEAGDMGAWTRVTHRWLARPALSGAQEEVDTSPLIEDAARRGVEYLFNHS